jgi:opacity protein-like surface antigen
MKLLILALTIIVLSVLPAVAAESYFGLEAGAWMPHQTKTYDNSFQQLNVEYSTGWGVGGTFGAAFNNGFRLEYELSYKQAEAKRYRDGMWSWVSMVNVWWDARNSSGITPYFGGGFGSTHAHVSSPGAVDENGYAPAYQVGAGVDIRIDQRLSLDIGYRYFGISDSSISGLYGGIGQEGSFVTTGLRMRF